MKQIHICDVSKYSDDFFKSSLTLLTPEEKKKVKSYKMEKDQKMCIVARLLEKKFLPSNEIYFNEFGKPEISGTHYNISHCFPYVVIAVNNEQSIGVDIQINKILDEKMLKYCFTNEELEKKPAIMLWTLKEALMKCIGTGIVKKPSSIHLLHFENDSFIYKNKKYYYKTFLINNYFASVVCEENVSDIEIIETNLEKSV